MGWFLFCCVSYRIVNVHEYWFNSKKKRNCYCICIAILVYIYNSYCYFCFVNSCEKLCLAATAAAAAALKNVMKPTESLSYVFFCCSWYTRTSLLSVAALQIDACWHVPKWMARWIKYAMNVCLCTVYIESKKETILCTLYVHTVLIFMDYDGFVVVATYVKCIWHSWTWLYVTQAHTRIQMTWTQTQTVKRTSW